MIRTLLIICLAFGTALAQTPFERRVAEAIRDQSLLAESADIDIIAMTPVAGAVQTIEIERFDRRSGHFEATIAHGSNRARISGRARVSVPVVVARDTLRRDHRITAADLDLRHVSIAQVPATAFSSLDEVVGAAVRRSLPAGRPVRQEDVGPPIVLDKNALIEIVYETPGMVLSASGRALDEGAVGDAVRVKPEGQGKIVIGEVAGPGRVVVR